MVEAAAPPRELSALSLWKVTAGELYFQVPSSCDSSKLLDDVRLLTMPLRASNGLNADALGVPSARINRTSAINFFILLLY